MGHWYCQHLRIPSEICIKFFILAICNFKSIIILLSENPVNSASWPLFTFTIFFFLNTDNFYPGVVFWAQVNLLESTHVMIHFLWHHV